MPFTLRILDGAYQLGISATIVTNGTYLASGVRLIERTPPAAIGVSVDASFPKRHDRIRGTAGAWERTVQGIKVAAKLPETQLSVISVLCPEKVCDLKDMPARLREWGISHWVINPLLAIQADGTEAFANDLSKLVDDLALLAEAAVSHQVHLAIDDEFAVLERRIAREASHLLSTLRRLPVRTLPPRARILRLLPSGHCPVGLDITRRLDTLQPRWNPDVDAAAFWEMLFKDAADIRQVA